MGRTYHIAAWRAVEHGTFDERGGYSPASDRSKFAGGVGVDIEVHRRRGLPSRVSVYDLEAEDLPTAAVLVTALLRRGMNVNVRVEEEGGP